MLTPTLNPMQTICCNKKCKRIHSETSHDTILEIQQQCYTSFTPSLTFHSLHLVELLEEATVVAVVVGAELRFCLLLG